DFSLTENGTILLSASYTDMGAPGSQSLTGTHTIYLTRPEIEFHNATEVRGGSKGSYEGQNFILVERSAEGNLGEIDFTNIKYIDFIYVPTAEGSISGKISILTGKTEGSSIASGKIDETSEPMKPSVVRMS